MWAQPNQPTTFLLGVTGCHHGGPVTPFLFPTYMTKTATIKLRIEEETKARWQKTATADGQSLSDYIRDMVEIGQAETERVRKIVSELEASRVKSLAK